MFLADRRFPTSNTNLAVCLAALRIPIKTQDQVYVVEETRRPQRPRANNSADITKRAYRRSLDAANLRSKNSGVAR